MSAVSGVSGETEIDAPDAAAFIQGLLARDRRQPPGFMRPALPVLSLKVPVVRPVRVRRALVIFHLPNRSTIRG